MPRTSVTLGVARHLQSGSIHYNKKFVHGWRLSAKCFTVARTLQFMYLAFFHELQKLVNVTGPDEINELNLQGVRL